MLIVIDIGNTNTVLGVFEGKKLMNHYRLETLIGRTDDEYAMTIKQLLDFDNIPMKSLNAVIIACVVPPLIDTFSRLSLKYFNTQPLIVGPGIRTGMPILYESPREVGADRIVNAVAAFEKFHTGLIVVDFGTATTFDVISPKGEYLGGVICPGIRISLEALFQRTAKLPKVEIIKPRKTIGKNTISSIQSGIYYGYGGLVDGLVTRIKKELDFTVRVIATGGLADLISEEAKTIEEVLPLLTLEGLLILYERNTDFSENPTV